MAKKKRYSRMNRAELAEATKDLDKEFARQKFGPLTNAGRAGHRRARRVGRPKVGRGAQRVLITMERGLLGQVDDFAKRKKLTRSQLMAEGVKRVMAGA